MKRKAMKHTPSAAHYAALLLDGYRHARKSRLKKQILRALIRLGRQYDYDDYYHFLGSDAQKLLHRTAS